MKKEEIVRDKQPPARINQEPDNARFFTLFPHPTVFIVSILLSRPDDWASCGCGLLFNGSIHTAVPGR